MPKQALKDELRPAVVLVHGLWMTGLEMGLLARRLEERGFVCRRFCYSSLRHSPASCADSLARFVDGLKHHPAVHLLGHSLGGRVIELMLSRHRPTVNGRVLTIATPFAGSHLAKVLAKGTLSGKLLGASAPLLLSKVPRWLHQRPLGTIAGDSGVGIGTFFPGMPQPHDGSVGLSETVIAGAAARFTVGGNHLSMLFSREVATLVCAFFQTGSFSRVEKRVRTPVAKPAAEAITPRASVHRARFCLHPHLAHNQ